MHLIDAFGTLEIKLELVDPGYWSMSIVPGYDMNLTFQSQQNKLEAGFLRTIGMVPYGLSEGIHTILLTVSRLGLHVNASFGTHYHTELKYIISADPNNNYNPTVVRFIGASELVGKILKLFSAQCTSIVIGLASNISSNELSGQSIDSSIVNVGPNNVQYNCSFVSNVSASNVNGIYVKFTLANNDTVYFYKKFSDGRSFNLAPGDNVNTTVSFTNFYFTYS